MKTGPKENWSSVKNALWKLVLLQNALGKFDRKFSDRFIWQNNDQCRHFIAAVDSKPMSLSWMGWQSQADIAGDQLILLAIFILLINGRIGHEGHISMPDRNGQYLSIPTWSTHICRIRQMLNADVLRLLSEITYAFLFSHYSTIDKLHWIT